MLEAAILGAIDRGELIFLCSEAESYQGLPMACDGEFLTILCEYEEEDGDTSSDLWILRLSAMISMRQSNTTWSQDRLDRILPTDGELTPDLKE